MKRHIFITLILLMAVSMAVAQPKFASKARKSIVSVNTYDAHGNLLRQGTAFFIDKSGTAIADYKTFKGAYKATVTDAAGKMHDVSYIMGADDAYSMVKFAANIKGVTPLTIASDAQTIGSAMHIIGKESTVSASVRDTSMIQGKYVYYGLTQKVDDTFMGAPVFNDKGCLVGIVHANIGEKSYVLDTRFSETLKIEAIPSSSASLALNNIHMPASLPNNQEEALVYLYFKSKSASNSEYLDIVNRFTATYPQCAEGYLRRATLYIDLVSFDKADEDMNRYMSLVADKADGHYKVASLIYDKLRLMPEPAYEKWTFDTAIAHLDDAIKTLASNDDSKEDESAIRRNTLLKAQIMTSKGAYDEAINLFEQLNKGAHKNPSIFYAISMARENRGDSISEVIAPIDSALAMFATPLPAEAAKYILRRGQLKAKASNYREAVTDYNQYSYLVNHQVNDLFYYERAVIEEEGRMFQVALNDINKAIEMSPRVPDYHLERAIICISVSMIDESIESCDNVIKLNPDIPDAYRILGYAKYKKGDIENAKAYLQKAIDMNDESAKTIMKSLFK